MATSKITEEKIETGKEYFIRKLWETYPKLSLGLQCVISVINGEAIDIEVNRLFDKKMSLPLDNYPDNEARAYKLLHDNVCIVNDNEVLIDIEVARRAVHMASPIKWVDMDVEGDCPQSGELCCIVTYSGKRTIALWEKSQMDWFDTNNEVLNESVQKWCYLPE